MAYPTLEQVVLAVAEGQATAGFVPIENSLAGAVISVVDLLIHKVNLLIEGEIVLPIHHCLLGKKGTELVQVKKVFSHPQALAQCQQFLATALPEAELWPVESTGKAAVLAAQVQEEGVAAIGTRLAGQLNNLAVLATKIEDSSDNRTRFIMLGQRMPPGTGHDRTSLALTPTDGPGGLHLVLGAFAVCSVNVIKVESRPAKNGLGNCIFWLDIQGHRRDPLVAQALAVVKSQCNFFKFLGSYPRWDMGLTEEKGHTMVEKIF